MNKFISPNWAGSVPRETLDLFSRYGQLLLKWNATINLVGKTTEADIWTRHIWDSYQLVDYVPRGTMTVADLGSGAGLPGLVLAMALPELAVTLVERDARKASFLREAARSLHLQRVRVVQDDAKNLSGPFDLVTSRALASLDQLLDLSIGLLGEGAICLFPKGENFVREMEEARKHWVFESQVIHSKTNEKAGIISVTELKPASGAGSRP